MDSKSETTLRKNVTVELSELDLTDQRLQVRQALDKEKVKEYEQLLRESGTDDLTVFDSRPLLWKSSSGDYLVLDGWHRLHAAQAAGITQVDADVLTGDETQATIQAMRANLRQGLPLKPEERVEACLRTIAALTGKDGVQPSNGKVAEALGVREGSIRNYRQQLETRGKLKPASSIRGKDGKVQAAKKATTRKPTGPSLVAKPEGSTDLKPSSLAGQLALRAVGPVMYNRNWDEVARMLKGPTAAAIPGNTPGNSEDQGILKRATLIIRGLDDEAWQACVDRGELADLVSELVQAGNAALKANGAAKTREKAA